MQWTVEFLNDTAGAALTAMPADLQASFRRIVELINDFGLDRIREPLVKHLEGPVWEMRMKGKDGTRRPPV